MRVRIFSLRTFNHTNFTPYELFASRALVFGNFIRDIVLYREVLWAYKLYPTNICQTDFFHAKFCLEPGTEGERREGKKEGKGGRRRNITGEMEQKEGRREVARRERE